MRVVSIDIETTGLDSKTHRVLEVGAVICNPYGEIEKDVFNVLIEYPDQDFLPVSPYCAELHTKTGLWARYKSAQGAVLANNFVSHFRHWLARNNMPEPITVVGKNFGSFDLQFLKTLPNWDIKLRHRYIDPAILFMQPSDEVVPDLNTCLKRAGIEASTDHTAVADAILTARLVIEGLKEKFPIKLGTLPPGGTDVSIDLLWEKPNDNVSKV